MLIEFKETFALPVDEVFSYFESPREWSRLYGFSGAVQEHDGWVTVPLKSFPFPLVAKNTEVKKNKLVRWTFGGFWRGEGEIRFRGDKKRVTLEGYERLSVRWLGPMSIFVEEPFMKSRFEYVWHLGWRRLRKTEVARSNRYASAR